MPTALQKCIIPYLSKSHTVPEQYLNISAISDLAEVASLTKISNLPRPEAECLWCMFFFFHGQQTKKLCLSEDQQNRMPPRTFGWLSCLWTIIADLLVTECSFYVCMLTRIEVAQEEWFKRLSRPCQRTLDVRFPTHDYGITFLFLSATESTKSVGRIGSMYHMFEVDVMKL